MAGEKVLLQIKGMTCDGCAVTILQALKRDKRVKSVNIDWQSGATEVIFDPVQTDEQRILENPVFRYAYEARAIPPAGCC